MKYIDHVQVAKRMNSRLLFNKICKITFFLSTLFGLAVLAVLIARVVSESIGWIDLNFLTGRLSNNADNAGIMGAVLGTLWLMLIVGP